MNSADRIIRVYEAGEVLACGKDGEPEPVQKLQDLVNRCVKRLSQIVKGTLSDFSIFQILLKCVPNVITVAYLKDGKQ